MMDMGWFLYLGGIIMLCMSINYMLMMLLSLEYMMLSLLMLLFLMLSVAFLEFVIFYMVVSVCEAVLGLSLLVLCNMSGSNFFYSSSFMLSW